MEDTPEIRAVRKKVLSELIKDVSYETREMAMTYEQQARYSEILEISHGEFLGGLKGSCPSCPFNDGRTEVASVAGNSGCLPSGYDIIQMKKDTGQNWSCHCDESKVCAGLCHSAKEHNLDLSKGGIIKYSLWDEKGLEAAVQAAIESERSQKHQ